VDKDTNLGGPDAVFPPTRCSILASAASPDPLVRRQALEAVIAAYWKPVYKYVRIKWQASNEDAKDLTQAFFTRALEKDFFVRYEPARARLRTYLRMCVDGFVANERQAAGRVKRGGDRQMLPLDFCSAEDELQHHPSHDGDLDLFFDREWVRALFGRAVEALRAECSASGKRTHFALFERYDLDGPDAQEKPTYTSLAVEFRIPVTQVTNHLAFARGRFRNLLLEALRSATGSEEEFREEARRLLGGPLP
jgi:DNA-directed RNA polymerase specialized sigma24 family protein